jgi:hypothetical protein
VLANLHGSVAPQYQPFTDVLMQAINRCVLRVVCCVSRIACCVLWVVCWWGEGEASCGVRCAAFAADVVSRHLPRTHASSTPRRGMHPTPPPPQLHHERRGAVWRVHHAACAGAAVGLRGPAAADPQHPGARHARRRRDGEWGAAAECLRMPHTQGCASTALLHAALWWHLVAPCVLWHLVAPCAEPPRRATRPALRHPCRIHARRCGC